MTESIETCILHPVLALFPQHIPLILLLFYVFPVSIIVISVIYYDISGCSYSCSSTRIFTTHLTHILLFTPLFLYATLCYTQSDMCQLFCLWLSLHYFLLQLVILSMLFSCSLMYLVTGISLLVRTTMTLHFSLAYCSLEYLLACLSRTLLVQCYLTNTDVYIYVSIHGVFTPTYPTTIRGCQRLGHRVRVYLVVGVATIHSIEWGDSKSGSQSIGVGKFHHRYEFRPIVLLIVTIPSQVLL